MFWRNYEQVVMIMMTVISSFEFNLHLSSFHGLAVIFITVVICRVMTIVTPVIATSRCEQEILNFKSFYSYNFWCQLEHKQSRVGRDLHHSRNLLLRVSYNFLYGHDVAC